MAVVLLTCAAVLRLQTAPSKGASRAPAEAPVALRPLSFARAQPQFPQAHTARPTELQTCAEPRCRAIWAWWVALATCEREHARDVLLRPLHPRRASRSSGVRMYTGGVPARRVAPARAAVVDS